jgi:hypothetical protein
LVTSASSTGGGNFGILAPFDVRGSEICFGVPARFWRLTGVRLDFAKLDRFAFRGIAHPPRRGRTRRDTIGRVEVNFGLEKTSWGEFRKNFFILWDDLADPSGRA